MFVSCLEAPPFVARSHSDRVGRLSFVINNHLNVTEEEKWILYVTLHMPTLVNGTDCRNTIIYMYRI